MHFSSNPMVPACRQAKRKPSFWAQIGIFFLIFLITTLATALLATIPTVFLMIAEPGIHPETLLASPTMTLVSLFLTVITTGGALIYCLCIEKRSALSMGFRKGTFWRSYSKGFLIGTGLLLLCCGIGYILGGFTVSSVMTLTPAYGVLFLLGFVIQGSSEEVLLRGYFMMSLSNRCRTAWAVGISSVVFSLLHIANPGFGLLPFINISLFGMFMGLYVYREGDLWGACAIHSAWNFVQGNILGVQVSGTGTLPTLWQFQPIEGKTLISGGTFGIEASIIVTAVLLATIAITCSNVSSRNADTNGKLKTENGK